MLVATFNSTSEWGSSVYVWEMSMSEMISEDWKIGGPQRSLSDLKKVRDFVKPQFGDREHKRDILISRLEDEGVSYYVEYDSNNKLAVKAPHKTKKMPGILCIAIVTHRETEIRALKQKVFVSEEWLKEHAGEKIKTTGWGINWVFPELVASHGTAITNVGAHEVESYIKNNKSKFTDGSHDGILLAKESSFSQGIDTVYIPLNSFRVASEYYNRVYGGYSTHALPTRNAERLGEAPKKETSLSTSKRRLSTLRRTRDMNQAMLGLWHGLYGANIRILSPPIVRGSRNQNISSTKVLEVKTKSLTLDN